MKLTKARKSRPARHSLTSVLIGHFTSKPIPGPDSPTPTSSDTSSTAFSSLQPQTPSSPSPPSRPSIHVIREELHAELDPPRRDTVSIKEANFILANQLRIPSPRTPQEFDNALMLARTNREASCARVDAAEHRVRALLRELNAARQDSDDALRDLEAADRSVKSLLRLAREAAVPPPPLPTRADSASVMSTAVQSVDLKTGGYDSDEHAVEAGAVAQSPMEIFLRVLEPPDDDGDGRMSMHSVSTEGSVWSISAI